MFKDQIREMDVAHDKVMMVMTNGAVYTVPPPPALSLAPISEWGRFLVNTDRTAASWPRLGLTIDVPQIEELRPPSKGRASGRP